MNDWIMYIYFGTLYEFCMNVWIMYFYFGTVCVFCMNDWRMYFYFGTVYVAIIYSEVILINQAILTDVQETI